MRHTIFSILHLSGTSPCCTVNKIDTSQRFKIKVIWILTGSSAKINSAIFIHSHVWEKHKFSHFQDVQSRLETFLAVFHFKPSFTFTLVSARLSSFSYEQYEERWRYHSTLKPIVSSIAVIILFLITSNDSYSGRSNRSTTERLGVGTLNACIPVSLPFNCLTARMQQHSETVHK